MTASDANDAPSSSRAKLVFWGGVAFVWLYLALHALNTPKILDDWYQVAVIKKHGLSLQTIWDNAVYNYTEHNPRIGENWLFITNGPWWINTLVAPTVEVFFFFVAFGIAFGRWPRPGNARDGQMLLVLSALIWLASPIPGILFVYRPFATNYLYAFTCTLLFLLPYRMAVDAGLKPRWWMIPAMFVAGWVAGMGNEHTGPTAGLAAFTLVLLYWRHHKRVQAWMVTGLAGIAIGYPMLFFAPGQKKRYGQIAARTGPGKQVLVRGIDGLYEIVLAFLWEAQLAVLVLLAGIFTVIMRAHRTGEPAPSPDRRAVLTMAGLVVAAFLIVATLFASPTAAERLFFASATLFACAGAVLVEVLARDGKARRVMVSLSLVAFVIHFSYGTYVYARAGAEGRDREARLERAEKETPGQIAVVPPLTKITRSLWFLGEDFDYASLREFVSHEVYGLGGIEFDRPVRAEPSVPFKAKLVFTYDPPVAQEEVWSRLKMPLSYVSAYPDRDVRLIRYIVPQLRTLLPGHRFVEVTAYVDGYAPDELRGRPLLNARWRESKKEFEVIDFVIRDDDDMRRFFLLLKGTVPKGLEEGYIHACGRTRKADMRVESRGVRMTYVPWCRGLLISVVCTKDECWNAATYWH